MSQGHGGGAAAPICNNCGAPDGGEHVICRYCKQAVSAEAQRTAIPCPNPQCRTLCRWGKQKCPQCQAWIVVSCVFCGAISPCNQSNCMQCNEAFAGAPQRKMMQQQQQQQQQNMEQAGVWGNVAASFLGAATGAALGGAFHSHDGCNSVDSCSSSDSSDSTDDVGDFSDVSDDTSFDFGGGDE